MKQTITARVLSDRRPILTYFLVIYFSSVFALYSRWGNLALLWSLLATLIFGVGIPAPLFVYKYGKHKGYAALGKKTAISFVVSFLFIVAITSWAMHAWVLAPVYGLLYYGYPGALIFALIQKAGWLNK